MAITEQTPYNNYTGNGSTTVFAHTFKLFTASDLKVYLDGVLKTITTDYTISGVGDESGGSVTFLTAPAASVDVMLVRSIPYDRLVDYQTSGDLLADTLDADLDRIESQIQQLSALNGVTLQSTFPLADYDAHGREIINLGSPTTGGSAVNRTYLDAALAGYPDNPTFITSIVHITVDTTITDAVIILPGGMFTISSGVTLTINGPFQCGLHQCFNCVGTGKVVFGIVADVYPDWWQQNAPGDTDMTTAITKAQESTLGIISFMAGKYKTTANIVFTNPVKFGPTAMLSITAGVVEFVGDVDAGWNQIVETFDDFATNPRANTSVKFWRHRVKAEWIGAKSIQTAELIKTISDQTVNINKAIRAAGGDYVDAGSYYFNEIAASLVELNTGFYRVDGTIVFGSQFGGEYYRLTGGGMVGQGPSSSFLLRTDLASTDYVVFLAFYTGELTRFSNLKISSYDPDAINKYSSAAMAMLFCQGDSLQISNIWVSGAQVSTTDSYSIYRNGVGIQFESCVDTFVDNTFVELCNVNFAFSSTTVSMNNITSYASYKYNIGFGNYGATWPDSQTTGNDIRIQNMEMKSVYGIGIHVLSKGENTINANGIAASAYEENSGSRVGVDFIQGGPYTSLNGSISQAHISGFTRSLVFLETGATVGYHFGLKLSDISMTDIPGSTGIGVIDFSGSTTIVNRLFITNLSLSDCIPIAFNAIKGMVTVNTLFLRNYTGVPDASTNRNIFVQLSGYLEIRNLFRDESDAVALTLGYQAGGTVLIDAQPVTNLTRAIAGSGTRLMPSNITFA